MNPHPRSFLSRTGVALAAAWAFALSAPTAGAEPAARGDGSGSYLVKVGWDAGSPQKLLDNLDRVRDLPFDGHTFKLGFRLQNAFWKEPIPAEEFEPHKEAMRELMKRDLGNAKHNLVMVWVTGEAGWDWFNDDHWAAALHNMRQLTELAAIGNCDLFFDPESYPKLTDHYGENAFWPFNYQDQPQPIGRSYDEFREVVYRRGQEFQRMLQEVDPDMDVLSMYGFAKFAHLLDEEDPEEMHRQIEASTYYNLLPSFFAGMLSEADDDFLLFDGNEEAYYYRSGAEFDEQNDRVLGLGWRLMPAEFREAFDKHYRMSHAIYASDLYAMDPEATDQYRAFFVQEMTRPEQAEFLAHNVYHALRASDRYAWFYTENDIDVYTGEVPDGMLEAAERAKNLLARGEPFPEGISERVAEADAVYQERIAGGLLRAEAHAVVLTEPPTIDGDAGDAAWENAEVSEPFHVSAPKADGGYVPEEATRAAFAQDGEHLYVLVRGELIDPSKLKSVGEGRDGDVWSGDDVEVAIHNPLTPERFFLFMVNPAGTRYDAELTIDPDGGEPAFDTGGYSPEWEVAQSTDGGHWTVEMAIPWSAIGDKPRTDQNLRLNVARSITHQPGLGFTSFSQTAMGFLDPSEFGTIRLSGR